jgi:hypothetical protein
MNLAEQATRFTLVLNDHDRDQLFRAARANERSAGAELRIALREHLERNNGDNGKQEGQPDGR